MTVRHYQPKDRDRVRALCCETGFLGQPVDPIFADRETFADFLTAYYTDAEPESALVMEDDSGLVCGYILGCCDEARLSRFHRKQIPGLVLRILGRYLGYPPETKRYIHWLIFRGSRETPPAPDNAAHFHINLLPTAKSVAGTREMIDRFLELVADRGFDQVYGQIVTSGDRRGQRMFERYGFELMNKREVTKFRHLHDEPVFLSTVVKDLRKGRQLYSKPEN